MGEGRCDPSINIGERKHHEQKRSTVSSLLGTKTRILYNNKKGLKIYREGSLERKRWKKKKHVGGSVISPSFNLLNSKKKNKATSLKEQESG